jgi:hypothetical protein
MESDLTSPGGEVRPRLEPAELAPEDEVGFLEDLLGFGAVGDHADDVEVEAPLILPEELDEQVHALGGERGGFGSVGGFHDRVP